MKNKAKISSWSLAGLLGLVMGVLVSFIPVLGIPGLLIADAYYKMLGIDSVTSVTNQALLVSIILGNIFLWSCVSFLLAFYARVKEMKTR